jgi:hypothetical protein
MELPTFDKNALPNHNDLVDISNSNYYTRFLSRAHNYQDTSMNIINLQRNAEVDMFFILKYKKQIETLKHVIIICCIGLIGSVLYHNGFITSDVYTLYLGAVFGIGLFIVLYDLFDIFIRNSINFNEYDYEFIYKPPIIPKSTPTNYNALELSNMPTIC